MPPVFICLIIIIKVRGFVKKSALIILGVLFTTVGFACQQPVKKNFWEQNHLRTDGRGSSCNHKPGTGEWEDEHIIPDLLEDQHGTSDGRGGFYY